MTQVTNMTPNALRDRANHAAGLDDTSRGYLRSAAAALEAAQRDLKRARRAADLRTTPEAKRTISALQADRRHLQDALDRLRVERETHTRELARCVRRLAASGRAPAAVLEDLMDLSMTMDAAMTHCPAEQKAAHHD